MSVAVCLNISVQVSVWNVPFEAGLIQSQEKTIKFWIGPAAAVRRRV